MAPTLKPPFRSWFLTVLAVAGLLVAAWIGLGPYLFRESVKIISVLPRAGHAKHDTDAIVAGIRMALDEAGGRAGRFSLVYEDRLLGPSSPHGLPPSGSTEAERAIHDPDVMVVLGAYDRIATWNMGRTLKRETLTFISPAYSRSGRAGLPQFSLIGSPSSADPELFRVVPSGLYQGVKAVEWASDMGVAKAYVVSHSSFFDTAIGDLFREEGAKKGIRVVGWGDLEPKNLPRIVDDVLTRKPDLVFCAAWEHSEALVLELDKAGYEGRIMLAETSMTPKLLRMSGAAAEGVYLLSGILPPPEEFTRRYRERYGSTPDPPTWYGYQAARAAIRAIEEAGRKDRSAVWRACASLDSFRGSGEPAEIVLGGYVVRGGAFAFVRRLE